MTVRTRIGRDGFAARIGAVIAETLHAPRRVSIIQLTSQRSSTYLIGVASILLALINVKAISPDDITEAATLQSIERGVPLRTSEEISGPGQEVSPRSIVVAPTFKLVFLTVVGLTLFSFFAAIFMAAIWEHPTENQQTTFAAAEFAWKAGIGAILGLIGGKVT